MIKHIQLKSILSKVLFIILAATVIYPLIFVLMTSLKSNIDVLINPFGIKSFLPSNYINAWHIGNIGRYFLNSVIITGVSMAIQIAAIVLASYSIGKLKPKGSWIIEIIYILCMLVIAEMITLPNFMTIKQWGLSGTRTALILPYITAGIPIGCFIMTAFVRNLPAELDEAARIDGAGIWDNFKAISVPLMKPVIITVFIFNIQGVWSEFYWALIQIKDDSLKTLPLGLMNFQSQYNSDYGILCAGLVIATLPVIILYLKSSAYFVGGLTAGAVKG
ncbi:MAG: carbohydrate ABC transporter permease [Lachnospiraceae bacterium]|nr:carbohydrate ABC transporter permease [Lachnospiraceae bacterium]